jgi:TonB family protein
MNLFAFNFLLNALWQIPLVFCAAWLAARLACRNGPQWEHRIWITALLLALLLPCGQLNLKPIAAWFLALFAPATPTTANASVIVSTGSATAIAPTWNLPPLLITLALAAWAAATLFFTARLFWRLHKTATLRRHAYIISAQEYPVLHNFLVTIPFPPQILVSQAVSGPAIIGILRPALLLPPSFLDRTEPGDLEAALAHEAAHLRRRDYAKNLFYEILTLPIAWHPLAWLTRTRIAESREILCDHLAARVTQGPQAYARALLRLASQQSTRAPQPIHAIGIFDTQSLERRIMQLTQIQIRSTLTRRLLTIAACAALAVTAGAFALGLHVDASTANSKHASSKPVHLAAGIMAGNRIGGENPKYPAEAKKKHIQGTVVVKATISKDGNIESARVISGPKLLREPSLKAIHTWRYKPYLKNGEPVAVETTINIVFSLGK